MKILLAQNMIYVPTHGGASKANRLLLEGLAAKGHTCRVVAPAFGTQVSVKTHEQFLTELNGRGIRLTSTSSEVTVFQYNGVEVHAVTDIARLRDYLASQIREFKTTWTLVSDDDPGQLMLESALEANPSRVVYLVHTPQALPFGPKGFLQNRANTDLVRQTAGIITVSNYIKDYIKQWSDLDSVALAFPVYGSGPFPALGCFDEGYVTLINPCAVKGISIFLELARRMPEVQFAGVPTWGTTGADRAAMDQLPNVRLLPPADNIEDIFRQTRILLMPSLWTENFPLTVTEAMLRGIPVIGSNSGGLPETKRGVDYVIPVRLIEQYEDRFDELGNPIPIVPDQDVDPWEEALRKLLSDRALYEQLSAASRAAALKFVSEIGIAPFEDYLENLKPASRIKSGDGLTPATEQGGKTNDLDAVLSKLSPERLELLARRLKKKNENDPKITQTIARRNKSDSVPLSFAQQRLWFIDQFDTGNPAYNNLDAFRLTGRLNVVAWERTINEIVRRHESLRTTFPTVDEQAVQIIASSLSVPLTVIDLSQAPETERESQSLHLVREESRRPFDLVQGPLLRTSLLRLGEEDHIVVLAFHHIVSDGWSGGVLFQEIMALYEAFSTSKQSPLPELPIQYADYAVWQRGWLQGELLEKQLSYWREHLTGAPPVLELPTDHPRPAVQSFRGARQSVMISKSLTEALRSLSQREGVTLFMTLLAAFQALLHHYSNQEEIVIGSPIAGRTRPETEGLIGLFVNTLVLRTDLSGDPTFRELLSRVREVALGAYAHQDLPFEKLVEELQPERSLSHNPLFQVMFILQNAPRSALGLSGLILNPLEFDNGTAQFDVTLSMIEGSEGLRATFEYNTDLFDAATITRMLGHFQVLLEGVVADCDRRLSELPLLTEAERHLLLIEWNNTAVEYPRNVCLHELFEAQVTRTPEAVAIVFEEEQLTYRELNQRANQLALYLRKLGVGPEVLVGIMVERSIEMVVGLLGILKAGGAYLPLDPAYPKQRLSFTLEDSQVPVLLTQEGLVESLPDHRAQVLCLDTDWKEIARESTENLSSEAIAENLAYLIYTSGSTGRPKGVAIEHRSAIALLHWAKEVFAPEQRAGVLASTSICFDLSVFELFVPLSWGGTIILAENALHLPTLRAAERVTLINTVPSAMAELLRIGGVPASVGTVNLAGEPLPTLLVQQIYQLDTIEQVFDLYGPSEDTTYSTFALRSGSGPATIGRPIANTQIYLLDRHMSPVPLGVPGELYIGGDGLARGYLNRPELTAEKFIGNPFSAHPGARLYKTGDRARYLPDGNLEFLGRIDHQVKVRGYRIELGEIEAVLSGHAAVREVVVMVREDVPGDKRLVAYVIPSQEPAPSVSELHIYLKEKLPVYMVPSAFVLLDELPMTPNGKVDRRALPAPDRAGLEPHASYVSPRTPAEEVAAKTWAEVLGVEQIGVYDNFFELGGHSLLATRVISRMREAFHTELPLRSLFEAPTVAELVERMEMSRQAGQVLPTPPLLPVPRDAELPLSFAQQQLWFLDQMEPGRPFYNILIAFRLGGALNITALEQSLSEVIVRHEVLRTTFDVMSGRPIQVITPAQPLTLPIVDLSKLPEPEREVKAQRLATEEAQRPFDLAQGPLLRASLLRLDTKEHVLLLTVHHIVCDGWSLGVFVQEMTALYEAFFTGQPSPLEPLPIQYADYAVWQREWLQGERLEQQLSYWKEQLVGAPAVLELPTARPRSTVRSYQGAIQSLVLSEKVKEGLMALSQREGVTLFMTLLAAFQTLLAHHTNLDDIVVGTDVANRNRVEVEGLIGFFVNQLVLRTDLSGNPSFRELLRRVREVALGAYAHQDVPFDKVVEALRPERSLSYTPLFQAKFVLQNVPMQALELSGLKLSTIEAHSGTVKFDLLLSMWETEQGLTGSLEYATDLFDAATISQMLGHFEILLGNVAAQPDAKLSALNEILDEADRQEQVAKRKELKQAGLQKVKKIKRKVVYAATETENAR